MDEEESVEVLSRRVDRRRTSVRGAAVRESVWQILGRAVPPKELVFCCQMVVVFAVVLASIYNLTVGDGSQAELWTALLSSCLGYILPNPQLRGQ